MTKQVLTAIIDADSRKFQAGMKKVKGFVGDLVKNFLKLGAVAVAAFTAAAIEAANFGDTIDKIAKRTGLTIEEVQKFQIAAGLAGADIATVEKSILRLSGSMFDLSQGLSTATDAFDALGIAQEDLEGKTQGERLILVLDALAGIEDKGQKAALAMRILGKSGAQLIPLADSLREGFGAAESVVLFDEKQVADSARLVDNIGILKSQIMGIVRVLVVQAFPSINNGLEGMSRRLADFSKSESFNKMVEQAKRFAIILTQIFTDLTGGKNDIDGIGDAMEVINNTLQDITDSGFFKSINEGFKDILKTVNDLLDKLQKVADFAAVEFFTGGFSNTRNKDIDAITGNSAFPGKNSSSGLASDRDSSAAVKIANVLIPWLDLQGGPQ